MRKTLPIHFMRASRHALSATTVLAASTAAVFLSPTAAYAQSAESQKTTRLEKIEVTAGKTAATIAEDNNTIVPTRNVSALMYRTPDGLIQQYLLW